MKTIDSLIFDLKNIGFDNLSSQIPLRDRKILKNIASLMTGTNYITENQGKLLLKILNENINSLKLLHLEIDDVLSHPTWYRTFRNIEKIRKVSLSLGVTKELEIKISYTFDKDIKKAIAAINKNVELEGLKGDNNAQYYSLSEKNIVTIFNMLNPLKFEFSPDFLDLYEKIEKLDLDHFRTKFNFDTLYSEKISKSKLPNIESLATESTLIKIDRKIRYQYEIHGNLDDSEKDTLTYKLANRKSIKLYLNIRDIKLQEIYKSLLTLNRNKILVIFDDFRISECIFQLQKLNALVQSNNLQSSTGIYFRFDNKDEGLVFNKLISDNKLNQKLSKDSKIVGISNGKLPKFMITSEWYPDAVISFTSSLRNNRTDVYCNDCDLIIYYTEVRPLISNVHEIL
jgi:hypothetical protein